MTSINAIRFDRYRGAIVTDESLSMDQNLTMLTSDKVRNCIPEPIRHAFGIVAGLAGTGSCSFTDTMRRDFHDWLLAEWRNECERSGGRPTKFMTMDRIAEGLFDLVVRVKNQRMSERVRGEFGFDVPEFLEGKFVRDGRSEEIRDRDITRRITDWLSWRNQDPEVKGIFLNAMLLAGYDEATGFQLYHVDLRDGYWHRVQTCYMAEGSGRFSVDPTMYTFVERLRIDERRGSVDPVEGIVAMLAALDAASMHETGVGGYPSVMLFDGSLPLERRQREIGDHRSWLASRVVKAMTHGFLDSDACHELVRAVFWEDLDFEEGWARFWAEVREPARLKRLFRGYKVAALETPLRPRHPRIRRG